MVATGPSPVSLGTAANYAILASSGISSVPESTISKSCSTETFLLPSQYRSKKNNLTRFFPFL